MSEAHTEIGVAQELRLDLTFEYNLPFDVVRFVAEYPEEESVFFDRDYRASISEAAALVRWVSHLVGYGEAAGRNLPHWEALDEGQIAKVVGSLNSTPSGAEVARVHFGSPFSIQVLLGAALTPPGLGAILYAVKRLYGFDLELRASREQKRIELLSAKKIADTLRDANSIDPPRGLGGKFCEEAEEAGADSASRVPESWTLSEGAITDE